MNNAVRATIRRRAFIAFVTYFDANGIGCYAETLRTIDIPIRLAALSASGIAVELR